jgi:amino acid permease
MARLRELRCVCLRKSHSTNTSIHPSGTIPMRPPLPSSVSHGSPALAVAMRLRGGEATTGMLGAGASLTKNILGIGVLTIAGGMSSGTGVGPASLAMILFTLMSAFTFSSLGDLCASTDLGEACTFEELWAVTLGSSSRWLVSAMIGSLTFAICSVYLMCLGQLLPPVLALVHAPPALRSRHATVALAAAALFPLCTFRSLSGLASTSILGVAALIYTALFSLWRYIDGSYHEGGRYHQTMPAHLRANFAGLRRWRVSSATALLVANLGVALCAHFNAPSFYRSLSHATPARFAKLAYGAFGAVLLLTFLIALPGYYTFGSNCQPLILVNYHPTEDAAATAARVATAASLYLSFPFAFAALREAALARLGGNWWATTCLLHFAVVATALAVEDLGLVVGLLGSVFGGCIMYATPAAMHLAQLVSRGGGAAPGGRAREVLAIIVDVAILLYGVFGQMITGTMNIWCDAYRERGRG